MGTEKVDIGHSVAEFPPEACFSRTVLQGFKDHL